MAGVVVINVSTDFAQAVRQSHQAVCEVTVISGETEVTAGALEGTVTLDRTATVRGRCDVSFALDTVDVPDDPADLLAPYGNEVRVARGVRHPGGQVELCPLGVFGIREVRIDDTGSGLTVRVAGLDRSQRFVDARIESAYQIGAGTPGGNAILALLQEAWPAVPYNAAEFASVTSALPASSLREGDDRWQSAGQIAESLGMTVWFDGTGTLRLTTAATPSASPVETIQEGAGGVLVQASAVWTREQVYNRVIATGENTSIDTAPPRGVATNLDPTSPTYYYGPFGAVPRFYSSPFIADDAQAEQAAAGILASQIGASRTVSFGSICMPYLEPGDVVTVVRVRAGINEAHTIDQMTVPLGGATMTCQTRAVAA